MQVFDAKGLTDGDVDQILSFLRAGGVIGFPTDTAYGLGADPFHESAVRRIFEIKGRPETKPILLLVNSIEMVSRLSRVPETAITLADRFWPGPLTLVLPALGNVPRIVTAGTATIGVRWPAAPFAIRMIGRLDTPITATSANSSGQPAAATVQEMQSQLGGQLEMMIDGGPLPAPGGSTVLDLTVEPPLLLREGPVSFDALSECLRGNILRREIGT